MVQPHPAEFIGNEFFRPLIGRIDGMANALGKDRLDPFQNMVTIRDVLGLHGFIPAGLRHIEDGAGLLIQSWSSLRPLNSPGSPRLLPS